MGDKSKQIEKNAYTALYVCIIMYLVYFFAHTLFTLDTGKLPKILSDIIFKITIRSQKNFLWKIKPIQILFFFTFFISLLSASNRRVRENDPIKKTYTFFLIPILLLTLFFIPIYYTKILTFLMIFPNSLKTSSLTLCTTSIIYIIIIIITDKELIKLLYTLRDTNKTSQKIEDQEEERKRYFDQPTEPVHTQEGIVIPYIEHYSKPLRNFRTWLAKKYSKKNFETLSKEKQKKIREKKDKILFAFSRHAYTLNDLNSIDRTLYLYDIIWNKTKRLAYACLPDIRYINLTQIYSSIGVSGTAGSGKTFFVILEIVNSMLKKNASIVNYDFKGGEFIKEIYDFYKNIEKEKQTKKKLTTSKSLPPFYNFNMSDITRCCNINIFHEENIKSIADCLNISEMLYGALTKDSGEKTSNSGNSAFFQESGKNFLKLAVTFLRFNPQIEKKIIKNSKGQEMIIYEEISVSSLAHLTKFCTYYEVEKLIQSISTFIEMKDLALRMLSTMKNAKEQFEGQISSLLVYLNKIALSKEILYFNNTNKEHTIDLDITSKKNPAIINFINNRKQEEAYKPILTFYIYYMMVLVNKPIENRNRILFNLDEAPTLMGINASAIAQTINTGRSNLISVLLGFQDHEQLKTTFGEKVAKTLLQTIGNTFSGNARGETAQNLSKGFGKLTKISTNKSRNTTDITNVNISKSFQEYEKIPASTLSTLPTGAFAVNITSSATEATDKTISLGQILINPIRQPKKKENIPFSTRYNQNLSYEENESKINNEIEEYNTLINNQIEKYVNYYQEKYVYTQKIKEIKKNLLIT